MKLSTEALYVPMIPPPSRLRMRNVLSSAWPFILAAPFHDLFRHELARNYVSGRSAVREEEFDPQPVNQVNRQAGTAAHQESHALKPGLGGGISGHVVATTGTVFLREEELVGVPEHIFSVRFTRICACPNLLLLHRRRSLQRLRRLICPVPVEEKGKQEAALEIDQPKGRLLRRAVGTRLRHCRRWRNGIGWLVHGFFTFSSA